MVKRPKSPDIVDDAKFLICHHPWPMNPNWEVKEDYVRFLQWIALIVGPDVLYAFYYKPKARRTVLIEIDRTCPRLDKLLGEHRWDEFLVCPTAEERGCNSKIFFSIYDTERSAQKDGWKRIHIQSSWFKNWVVDEKTIRIPYPDTYWCDIPGATEDPTNKGLSRFLPKSMKPRPPKVVVPVVGSKEWIIQRLIESSSAAIQRAPPPYHPSSPVPSSWTSKTPIRSVSPPGTSFYPEDSWGPVTSTTVSQTPLGGSPVLMSPTQLESTHSRKSSIEFDRPSTAPPGLVQRQTRSSTPSSLVPSRVATPPPGLTRPSKSVPFLGVPNPQAKPLSPGHIQATPTATYRSTATLTSTAVATYPSTASTQVIPRPLQTFVQMVRERAAALGILAPQTGLAPQHAYNRGNARASFEGMPVCEGGRGLGFVEEKEGCEGEQKVPDQAQDEEGQDMAQEKEVKVVLGGGEGQAGADSDQEIVNPFESLAWLKPGAEAVWGVIPEEVTDVFVSRRPVPSQSVNVVPFHTSDTSCGPAPSQVVNEAWGSVPTEVSEDFFVGYEHAPRDSSRRERPARDHGHGRYQDESRGQYRGNCQRDTQDRNHSRYQAEDRAQNHAQGYGRYHTDARTQNCGRYEDQVQALDRDYRGRYPQPASIAHPRELQLLEEQEQDQYCNEPRLREYPRPRNGPQHGGPQDYGHYQNECPSSELPILKWGDEPLPEPQPQPDPDPEFDFDSLPWLRPGAEAAWGVDSAIKPGFMYDRRAGVVAGDSGVSVAGTGMGVGSWGAPNARRGADLCNVISRAGPRRETWVDSWNVSGSGSAGGAGDIPAWGVPTPGANNSRVGGSGPGLGLMAGYDRVYESEGLCPHHGVLCDERCEIGRRKFEQAMYDEMRGNGGKGNYEDQRGAGRGRGRRRGYVPRISRVVGYDGGYGGDRYA